VRAGGGPVRGVDQDRLPQQLARAGVRVEGVQAVVLGGDEYHVVPHVGEVEFATHSGCA
jgi:hypothetical protein